MTGNGANRFDRWLDDRLAGRWARRARGADTADLSELEQQRSQAHGLRHRLDRLIHVADARLGLPRIGSATFPRPPGTDWAWRPDLWRGPMATPGYAGVHSRTPLGSEVTLFHDCADSELTVRQVRNQRESDLAPFGLQMDVFRFGGSFLSLVLDLPDAAINGLRKIHLLRIDARLNVRHGPNTEQIVQELPAGAPDCQAAFDLAYTKLNEKRIEKAWVDLILEGPQMNQIKLRDLTMVRYPRALL
jgi:Family of unknown function (DUF6478)